MIQNINFSKLEITKSDLTKVKKIISSGWLTHGKYTTLFENEFWKFKKNNRQKSLEEFQKRWCYKVKIITLLTLFIGYKYLLSKINKQFKTQKIITKDLFFLKKIIIT